MSDLLASTSDLDMDRICRLCCTEKNRMRPLFKHRGKYPFSLCQMIYATAQVEVDPNDGLPQKICALCVSNLIKMFHTIDSYRENDLMLRQQLERTSVPDDIEDVAGALVVCIQKEDGDKDCTGPALMNDSYENQDVIAEANDNWTPTGMNICIKAEPGTLDDSVEGIPTEQNLSIKKEKGVFEQQNGGRRSTRLTIGTRDKPLDVHNEEKGVAFTDWNLDLVVPQQVSSQEIIPEPVQKRPRGRPKRNVEETSRPKLNDHKCYICKSESHGTAAALLTHMNSTHGDLLPFTCPECVMETIVLTNLLTLNGHMRRHLHPEKCPHCDKRYLSKCKVDIHVKQQHRSILEANSKGPTECKKCNKMFPSMVKFLQHEKRVHTTSTTVSCTVCHEKFPNRTNLRTHIKKMHEGNTKKFECNMCLKKVSSLRILQSHMETYHTNSETEFRCSNCQETFSRKSLLRAHEKKGNCEFAQA